MVTRDSSHSSEMLASSLALPGSGMGLLQMSWSWLTRDTKDDTKDAALEAGTASFGEGLNR